MGHAPVREEHLVENARQRLEVGNRQLDQVIGLAGQGVGLLDFFGPVDELLEAPGVVRRMRRQGDVDEGEHSEPERLGGHAAR